MVGDTVDNKCINGKTEVEAVHLDAGKNMKRLTVLFCGHGFEQGYKFSVEEAQKHTHIQVVRCQQDELAQHIADADVLVPLMAPLDRSTLQMAKKTKLILQYGVGLEGVDVAAATELGILVSNMPAGPSGNALSCAEMAIYLALCCLRDQTAMVNSVRNKVLGLPCARTLFGTNCLIVGYGAITKELIPRLKAFGTKLACVRRSTWGESEVENIVDCKGSMKEMQTHSKDADVIFLCCVLNEETRNLVSRAFLEHCKDGVVIVNVARGGLLEYESVMEALKTGKIGALGADVMWSEPVDPAHKIFQHPNVYITPHVAGVTQLSYRAMAKTLVSEVEQLGKGLLPTVRCNNVDRIREC